MYLFVKPVANHKSVDESEPMGFHWMVLTIVETAYGLREIICDNRARVGIYVFRYWLGIAMNATVVEVGFGGECCGLGSANHWIN